STFATTAEARSATTRRSPRAEVSDAQDELGGGEVDDQAGRVDQRGNHGGGHHGRVDAQLLGQQGHGAADGGGPGADEHQGDGHDQGDAGVDEQGGDG